MAVNGYKFTALTGGGAGALDAQDGTGLGEGDWAVVMVGGLLYNYQLSATSGATESSPNVIAPDANAGAKRWLIQRVPAEATLPVGSIIPWAGGYCTNGSNAGFTSVLGNTVAAVNALLNADGFYVLDGSALNLSGSPIYDGAGRYLYNLTNDIYLRGDTVAGLIGGSNTDSHTHTTGSFTLTTNEMPSHYHNILTLGDPSGGGVNRVEYKPNYTASTTYQTESSGGGASHNHGATSIPSVTSNEPNFFSCFYIQKVI